MRKVLFRCRSGSCSGWFFPGLELVPGTLQVDPIANYGAVEIGVHRFHHPGDDRNVGEAQFVTLWQHKDSGWQVSFDHHAAGS